MQTKSLSADKGLGTRQRLQFLASRPVQRARLRTRLSTCRGVCEERQLVFRCREAHTSAEYRAAAAVRAASFYTYPVDRSELAIRAHVRMKVDAEWLAIEAKALGRDPSYKDLGFSCMIATVRFDPDSNTDDPLAAGLDASCRVPNDEGSELVIGTLDLNRGWKLPAEELVGREPQDAEGARNRIYLSNVCVAPGARRRGVARGLLDAAVVEATKKGASRIYVHVVHDNEAAAQAYIAAGFMVEAEETAKEAQHFGRPRRLLLSLPEERMRRA